MCVPAYCDPTMYVLWCPFFLVWNETIPLVTRTCAHNLPLNPESAARELASLGLKSIHTTIMEGTQNYPELPT